MFQFAWATDNGVGLAMPPLPEVCRLPDFIARVQQALLLIVAATILASGGFSF